MSRVTRRRFLQDSTTLAAGLAVAAELNSALPASAAEGAFSSQWKSAPDRVWLGPEFWANPMQDWRTASGRIECVNAAPDRNVHLLTRDLATRDGDLQIRMTIGRVDGALGKGKGSAGFRIGVNGPLKEYRNNLLSATGIDAGLTSDGGLFIGEIGSAKAGAIKDLGDSVELRLTATSSGKAYSLKLSAHAAGKDEALAEVTRDSVKPQQLVGNIAIVNNFGRSAGGGGGKGRAKAGANAAAGAGPGTGKFWFADLQVSGTKVAVHDDRAFGPILFNQYTLSNGVMKMTAQMPPIGAKDAQTVALLIDDGKGGWKAIGEEKIHPEARTATFRVEKWDDKRDVSYRLAYSCAGADGKPREYTRAGTVRRDPVDKPILSVADISCNTHTAFPNPGAVANLMKLQPDLVAFVGDQFYESSGGYGTTRKPLDTSILDYLRKWYLHGWTWAAVTKDCPSLSLPDDHDVYQGNIWGEGGAPETGTQEQGGYEMPPGWVNVVHRTQSSHHPDAYDPTPIKQGISVYYGPLTYGRVSFAVLADRQFKSGPEGKVPRTKDRGDHVTDPNWQPKIADVKGLQLLGDRQLKFIREWAQDWRGAEMKAVISQTIFTAMATTHGGNREKLRADYDANGWPQTARNEALREIRKCFPVHIAGDQHLPAMIHYGIDAHRDGPVAFTGPALNCGYPRWFEPEKPGENRKEGAPPTTGDFADCFGNPMTILAVANPPVKPSNDTLLENLNEKSSGIGMVRFDKTKREITFECWPLLADPAAGGKQYPGWPVTVGVMDNYGKKTVGHLPKVSILHGANLVVQVINQNDGEIVYSLRIAGDNFQPPVFEEGKYTVKVINPDTGATKELKDLQSVANNDRTVEINV